MHVLEQNMNLNAQEEESMERRRTYRNVEYPETSLVQHRIHGPGEARLRPHVVGQERCRNHSLL